MVLAPAALGVSAGPARAEATLKVEAGYGGGQFMPGRQVPVRVTITADRLVRGTLQLSLDVGGESGVFPLSLPVEVAGGTSKEVVVAMPTVAGLDRAEVEVTLSGANLQGKAEIGFDGSTDLVGLLPDLVQRVPQAEPLPGDMGVARFAQLEDNELDTAGALDPLGTIVSGADGLASLSDAARRNVIAWLEQGGRLVVDSHPGDIVNGLPVAWQPGQLTRLPAGRGEVRYSSGAAGEGRWADVVEPTPLVLAGDVTSVGMFGPQSLPEAVGLDGGLRIPTVGWLAGFLVLYVLIVGPVVFLFLRVRGRVNWIWLSVASLAVLFAAGAFVAGSDLRSGSEVSHGTMVHTGPGGARASTFVGLVSRSGVDGRAAFPEGWSASGLTSVLGSPSLIIARDPFGGGGQDLSVSPASVRIDGDGTRGEVDLDPGGFGMVSGWGSLAQTEGLEVTAEAAADGSVRGTVRNASALTLDEVVVVVGVRSWGADDPLAPGEQVDWTLPPTDGLSTPGGPVETSWHEATGWDGDVPRSTPINYALWSATVLQHADPYPTGLAIAAGWTRGWTPPVDVGGPIEKGRTVFTSEAPVTAAPGSAPMPAIRRDYLRGSAGTPIAENDMAAAERLDNEWGVGVEGAVVRFVLPPAAGTDGSGLRAFLPANVLRIEVWDGDSWEPQQRRQVGTDAPMDDEELTADFEPWDPGIRSMADIPAEAVHNGVLYVRLALADTGGGGDTSPGVLLGPAGS